MATFTWTPDYGASADNKPKVSKLQFGDGYAQYVGEGINNIARSWSLKFVGDETYADEIEAFLDALESANFDWTPPVGDAGKWVCLEDYTRTRPNYGQHEVGCKFTEVFEV